MITVVSRWNRWRKCKAVTIGFIFGGVGGIGGGRGQWLGDTMASAKHARAYNWGLGAEPPAGPSRGRASGQGVRGRSPPEAENILVIGCPTEPANLASLD